MASNFHAMGLENGRPCNLQLRRLETPIWCNNHVVFHVDWLPHWPLRRRFGYGFIHVCFILIYWWAWLACRLQAIECRIESNNPPPAFQLLTSTSTTALQKATLQCAPPFARNFDSDSDVIRLGCGLPWCPCPCICGPESGTSFEPLASNTWRCCGKRWFQWIQVLLYWNVM